MKDGNMDEMEGCDGQGHVTMEILQRHDVQGYYCDYLTQTHTSRSLVQRVKHKKEGESDRFGVCYSSDGETRELSVCAAAPSARLQSDVVLSFL